MPAKKSARKTVSQAFPPQMIDSAHPVETTPTVRKGVSRAAVAAKFKGVRLPQTLGKSKAETLLIRPESASAADSRTVSKSVIADGTRIIAVQG